MNRCCAYCRTAVHGCDSSTAATPEYTLRLERRVESLESRGIRVILFTPHLIPPFNIEGCVPRPLAEKRNTCELGLEAHAL